MLGKNKRDVSKALGVFGIKGASKTGRFSQTGPEEIVERSFSHSSTAISLGKDCKRREGNVQSHTDIVINFPEKKFEVLFF